MISLRSAGGITPRDLIRRLDRMGKALGSLGLEAGLVEVAKPITRDLVSMVPVRSGRTRASIGYQPTEHEGRPAVQIGGVKTWPNMFHIVDQGRRSYIVQVRRKKVLSNRSAIFGRRAQIPGSRGGRYSELALKKNSGSIDANFIRGVSRVIGRI